MKFEDLREPFSEEVFLAINSQLIEADLVSSKLSVRSDSPRFITDTKYYGTYDALDLHILMIEHSSAEDARVGVSLDIFKLMKKYSFQNALVAAHSKNSNRWRYSLITSSLSVNDKGKISKEFSNPRRYSFVLGPHQKVLTPYKQLIQSGRVSDIEELSKRFSLEVVNNEFYREIAKLYDELVGTEKISRKLKYPSNGDESHEFAVRLIGRIIFCWFLREKMSKAGISLVPNNILSREASNESGYYHSVLAPLFFEVLNKPVSKRTHKFTIGAYADIPYLNGGLFNDDNIDHYKFNKSLELSVPGLVDIPNSWFHELFDLLERFNFTVDENTSYDTDLSIDPEMLGRVFENLLARINPDTGETVRKSTGSFYTPREIVDYMVDASITEYLHSKTKIDRTRLDALVSYDLFDDIGYELSNDEKVLVLRSLSTLTVLDPACGSGAFPIGMLQKIVFIISQLDPKAEWWLAKQLEGASPELRREFANRSVDYVRKLGIIRQTIFGVDIQPIATEISRLRCFLTLIVDEAVDDNQENRGIRPLPNLEFKFITANTLIKPPQANSKGNISLFDDFGSRLSDKVKEYFSAQGEEKISLLHGIRDLIDLKVDENTRYVLNNAGIFKDDRFVDEFNKRNFKINSLLLKEANTWKSYNNVFKHKPVDFFGIEYFFPMAKDGFDIVIGNPPYVKKEHLKESQVEELEANYIETIADKQKKWSDDLYVHFIFRAFDLARKNGIVCYITNDSFVGFKSKSRVRQLLMAKGLRQLVKCPSETFNATIYTAVFLAENSSRVTQSYMAGYFEYPSYELRKTGVIDKNYIDSLPDKRLALTINPIIASLSKLNTAGECLYFIDGGIDSGNVRNKIFFKDRVKDGLSRLLQGRQIQRWAIWWDSPKAKYKYCDPQYVSRPELGIGRGGKPSKATEYWNFRGDPNNHHKPERLLVRQTEDNVVAAYQSEKEDGQFYTDNTLFTILLKDNVISLKYAACLLNSKLLNYYYKQLSLEEGKALAQVKIGLLEQLPFVVAPDQKVFVEIADRIIEKKRADPDADVLKLESQIDHLVYKLYDLTPDEIEIIEGTR